MGLGVVGEEHVFILRVNPKSLEVFAVVEQMMVSLALKVSTFVAEDEFRESTAVKHEGIQFPSFYCPFVEQDLK